MRKGYRRQSQEDEEDFVEAAAVHFAPDVLIATEEDVKKSKLVDEAKTVVEVHGVSTEVVALTADSKPGLAYCMGALLALHDTGRLNHVRSYVAAGMANLLLVLIQQARTEMRGYFQDNYAILNGKVNEKIAQEAEEWHWYNLMSDKWKGKDCDLLRYLVLPRIRQFCLCNVEYEMTWKAIRNVFSMFFAGKDSASCYEDTLTDSILDHRAMVATTGADKSLTQPRFIHVVSQAGHKKPLLLVNYGVSQKDVNSPVLVESVMGKPLSWLASRTSLPLSMGPTRFAHGGLSREVHSALRTDPLCYTAAQHAYETVRGGQPEILKQIADEKKEDLMPNAKLTLVDAWSDSQNFSLGCLESLSLVSNQERDVNGSTQQKDHEHLRAKGHRVVRMYDPSLDSIQADAESPQDQNLKALRALLKKIETRGLRGMHEDEFDLAFTYGYLSTLFHYEPKAKRGDYASAVSRSNLVDKFGLEQLFL